MDLQFTTDEINRLIGMMHAPNGPLSVVIVDDESRVVQGMLAILKAWPNITVRTIILNRPFAFSYGPDTFLFDIMLLDEYMKWAGTGTQLYNELNDRNLLREMIVASTSSNFKSPEYTQWHFRYKEMIGGSFEYASSFVQFMNKLIEICELRNKLFGTIIYRNLATGEYKIRLGTDVDMARIRVKGEQSLLQINHFESDLPGYEICGVHGIRMNPGSQCIQELVRLASSKETRGYLEQYLKEIFFMGVEWQKKCFEKQDRLL